MDRISGFAVFDNGDKVPLAYSGDGRELVGFEAGEERYVPSSLLAEWYGLAVRNALDQYVDFDYWDDLVARTEAAL